MAAPRVLKRFPFDLNLGTDICHVVRIRSILESSRRSRFVEKILNADERGHPKICHFVKNQASQIRLDPRADTTCSLNASSRTGETAVCGRTDSPPPGEPSSHELQAAATFMAGRFAAKEAVIKAHPQRALTWHDITITSGRRRPAAEQRAGAGAAAPVAIVRDGNEDHEALVSISHDGEYATAVCLAACTAVG